LADRFVNVPQLSREFVNFYRVLQSRLEKVVIVGDLVHQLVEDGLQLDGFVVLILGEGRRKQDEWSKVKSVSVVLILLSHADPMHQAEVLPLLHKISQFFLGQRDR